MRRCAAGPAGSQEEQQAAGEQPGPNAQHGFGPRTGVGKAAVIGFPRASRYLGMVAVVAVAVVPLVVAVVPVVVPVVVAVVPVVVVVMPVVVVVMAGHPQGDRFRG